MELWNRLLTLLRMKRGSDRRYFELDESLLTALVERADREQRPAEEIQAELLTAGLIHLQTADGLMERWGTLSQRKQEVTALTCLGYTNRQMAARMGVSPDTVKGYVRQALVKFHLHSKDERRRAMDKKNKKKAPPPSAPFFVRHFLHHRPLFLYLLQP